MSGEPDDLNAFTRSLANVPPHPGQLDRDALLFAAGRAAGRRGTFWPVLAGALAILSTVLTVTLFTRTPTVVERIVHVPTPVPAEAPPVEAVPRSDELSPPTSPATSPSLVEALRLRQRVLRDGVAESPTTAWTAGPTSSSSEEVPDLSSLRLNAAHSNGEPFR